ncbi:MAG: hypothetical protein HOW73_38450 [Polyangiaceae bacterium]|nr:hypothetical protein [Polyangiaceae bacterium]
MASESSMVLDGLAVGVDHLESIVVFLLTVAQPYASWTAPGQELRPALVAERMRQTYLAAEDALRVVDGDASPRSGHPGLMLESSTHLVMIHRVRSFGVAAFFSREAPLGFARMATRQIVSTLEQDLPYPRENHVALPAPLATGSSPRPTTPSSVPSPAALDFDEPAPDTTPPRSIIGDRVRAVVSHLEAIAPDPHIVRMRLALRTGLGLEALVQPDQLNSDALLLIETAAEDILGLDRGKLTEVAHP